MNYITNLGYEYMTAFFEDNLSDEKISRIIKPAVEEIRGKMDSFRGLEFTGFYDGRNHIPDVCGRIS